jgi:peptide/nickel transport system substrate-binding protein
LGERASFASEVPKRGGTLNFAVVAEPPTTDCHATTTFAMLHPVAPQYSTLLAFVGPHDKINIEGDLAQSREIAQDGLSYTFRQRRGVKFHDGSDFTSEDVKATYERIIDPPAGVVSARRAQHQDIQAIETPDPYTVVFKMARVNMSMELHFASPFNCIYSAIKLKQDPKYPETEMTGTGAFKSVEYLKGSHWRAVRFDQYFSARPSYLGGYKAIFVRSNTVVNGLRGGQYDAEFRGRAPQERDQLVAAMKDQVTVQEGPWVTNILLTFNTERKPFDDLRVRQALALAIDRWGGSEALGKISLIKGIGGTFRPGASRSLPMSELEHLPGFGRDIERARAEARRLLQEAGQWHALTMAYNIPLLWYQRIVVNNKKVKGGISRQVTSPARTWLRSGSMNRTCDVASPDNVRPTRLQFCIFGSGCSCIGDAGAEVSLTLERVRC